MRKYPYTNFHELNLDWILKTLEKLKRLAVRSVNGVKPDETGNVVLPSLVGVQSVNRVLPDQQGNVDLGPLVTSVNSKVPVSGNVQVGTVRTVNGQSPDTSGALTLDVGGNVKTVNGIAPDPSGNVQLTAINTELQTLTDLTDSIQDDVETHTAQISTINRSRIKSVTEYGAVGDGVADDSAAIQAAVNDSSIIYFPPGTYKVETTISLNVDGKYYLTILGSDPRQTIISGSNTDVIFDFTRPDQEGEYRIDIRGVGFSGNRNSTTAIKCYGRMSEVTPDRRLDSNALNIENAYALNLLQFVDMGYTNHCHFTRCYADTVGVVFNLTRAASFIYFSECYSVYASLISASDDIQDGISNGIFMSNCVSIFSDNGPSYNFKGYQAVYLSECTADLSHYAGALINCLNVTDFDFNGGWISGHNITGSTAIKLYNTFFGNVRGFTIANVDLGVDIANDTNNKCSVSIYGNRFALCKNLGIYAVARGLSILSNTFDLTIANTVTFGSGDKNVVVNNIFANTFTVAAGDNSIVSPNIYSA